jgi:hypothetical protein
VNEAGISCTGVEKCPLRLSAGKAGKPFSDEKRKFFGKRRKQKGKRSKVFFHPLNNYISIQGENDHTSFPRFQDF